MITKKHTYLRGALRLLERVRENVLVVEKDLLNRIFLKMDHFHS